MKLFFKVFGNCVGKHGLFGTDFRLAIMQL